MPLIAAQPAAERDTLSLRLDRALHRQLKAYAEFISSSKDCVISQALHQLSRHDKDFAAWLAAQPGYDLLRRRPHVRTQIVDSENQSDRYSTQDDGGRLTSAARRATCKQRDECPHVGARPRVNRRASGRWAAAIHSLHGRSRSDGLVAFDDLAPGTPRCVPKTQAAVDECRWLAGAGDRPVGAIAVADQMTWPLPRRLGCRLPLNLRDGPAARGSLNIPSPA
jgi:hypothetical protein